MINPDDWKNDPLVIVQDALWPPCWMAAEVLAVGCPDKATEQRLLATFDGATRMMQHDAARLMTAYGVNISEEDQARFDEAAVCLIASRKHLHAFCSAPEDLNVRARATTSLFQHTQPCVAGAIHHLRRIFISLILLRQKEQAQQTSTAIDGLDRISKQIFFISINASVEAARAGEAGRGFLQISTDIRALSQSAQAATRDLSNLVADNRNQI